MLGTSVARGIAGQLVEDLRIERSNAGFKVPCGHLFANPLKKVVPAAYPIPPAKEVSDQKGIEEHLYFTLHL